MFSLPHHLPAVVRLNPTRRSARCKTSQDFDFTAVASLVRGFGEVFVGKNEYDSVTSSTRCIDSSFSSAGSR
jgi:hypothetical protein